MILAAYATVELVLLLYLGLAVTIASASLWLGLRVACLEHRMDEPGPCGARYGKQVEACGVCGRSVDNGESERCGTRSEA